MRAPIVPGKTETLAHMVAGTYFAAISDQGVFWVQAHRLVRQMVDDFLPGPDPAQGTAGGPCFGDLSCADGLSCVDKLCE